jgi:hypothetical protein
VSVSVNRLRSVQRAISRSVGLVPRLRAFLSERVTLAGAEDAIKVALEQREEYFLKRVEAEVFRAVGSPYRPLFESVGCDYADLATSVRRVGLEKTLTQLAREGLYLTSDEFKGKEPVVRRGRAFTVTPEEFLPVDLRSGFFTTSSGTRDRPVRSFITLNWLAVRAFAMALWFETHGLRGRTHAIFEGILPSGAGVNNVLIYARMGERVERWFTRKRSVDGWVPRQYYYLTTRAILRAVNELGPGRVHLEFLDVSEISHIVRWVQEVNRRGASCCIFTPASNAARIARTAADLEVSLAGTKFVAVGEPLTDAKHAVITRTGANVVPSFAYGGGVTAGLGCAAPRDTDDHHVNEHLIVLQAHPEPLSSEGTPIYPLLCTTVHPASPRLLINVQNGDYATLARRSCGCALGQVGLTLHASTIRSYEKLTSEGMNYYFVDLYQILETTLPAEFGGGPGDYQLVEEEDRQGQTRLTLRVAPAVGPVDEARLLSRLRAEMARGSRGNRFMEAVWSGAGTLRVSREVPHASQRGKILPLHIPR